MDKAVADPQYAVEETPEQAETTGDASPHQRPRRRWTASWHLYLRADLIVFACYLLSALWVFWNVWGDPSHRVLIDAVDSGPFNGDQLQFEYWLAHAVEVITNGLSPLHDSSVNAPLGINLMANTSTLGISIPLAPITLLWGPPVAFAVWLILAPTSTALAWYWLFSRHLVASRVAATIGGAFCGFAPGLISQTNGHPNIATQFLVPLILWRTVQLARGKRPVRHGLVLGALVIWQAFINEEILFFTAFACLVFFAVWAVSRPALVPSHAPRFLGGLVIAGGLALAVLAVPLWHQFFGPQAYHGLGGTTNRYGADLHSFTAYPTYSLAGDSSSLKLANSTSEQTTFFGWGLSILVIFLAVALWRNVVARCATVTAAVFGLLSLGWYPRVDGIYYPTIWTPFRPLTQLPILESVICTRLALFMIPAIAVLIALTVDRLRASNLRGELRLLLVGGLAAALIPLVPTPVPAVDRPLTPEFISSGEWKTYIPPGRTMLVIPVDAYTGVEAMQWDAALRLEFVMVGGYFLVPNPDSPDHVATFGAPKTPTAKLWDAAARGELPNLQPADRTRAQEDLTYWRAGAVILTPRPHDDSLRELTTQLLGFEPTWVHGVWLWDIPD